MTDKFDFEGFEKELTELMKDFSNPTTEYDKGGSYVINRVMNKFKRCQN